tara:strand:+ start:1695 stop:2153 length:459 start_codon:yes stop_codon:yes gene_type:complete
MYVKISNGAVEQYPYTLGNLRRDNPNTSFPKRPSDEMLVDWGVYPVTVQSGTSFNYATQKLAHAETPTLVNGVWTLVESVASLTSEEATVVSNLAAQDNRDLRDRLLAETDFYALSDVTMSAEMTTYRQALRDITSHSNWPYLEEADWPTKP